MRQNPVLSGLTFNPTMQFPNYSPSLLLRNGHVNTLFASKFRDVQLPDYQRIRLETDDADFLDLDQVSVGSDRVVLLLHGLEGNSHRPYIRGMAHAMNGAGWDVAALNFRSCSGEPNRKALAYHSGATEDLEPVLQKLKAEYDSIVAVGYSLGGNLLLKYLGEQGEHSSISAAVAISVPCDLKGSSEQLTALGNGIYMRRFLRSLRKKMEVKAALFPDEIDVSDFDWIKTFRQFDDRYTAPLHGFINAEDYWAKCNCLQFLPSITTPALIVNALDDPFLSKSCFPYERVESNPALSMITPKYGGHVGFAQKGPYWSEQVTVQYLSAHG